MPIRPGMSWLLDRARTLVNDTPATVNNLTNQEIQDALDEHCKEERYCPLIAVSTVLQGGSVTFLAFQHEAGWWEGIPYSAAAGTAAYYDGTAGFCLLNGTYGTVIPSSWDLQKGRFTFTSEPTRPVMLTGFRYDLYGAAADLLEVRAGQVSEHFDFRDAGVEYSRSQKQKMVLTQVERYRARQWVGCAELVRRDTC